MKKVRGRGTTATWPLVVACDLTLPPAARREAVTVVEADGTRVEVKVTDVSPFFGFGDFRRSNETLTAPLCDLFDRRVALPEVPFAAGAYPEWNRTRPYLTGQHVWSVPAAETAARAVTEGELMEDLLFVFMGLGGEFLQPVFTRRKDRHQELRFELKADVEGSAQALLRRMLPLCEAVFVIQRYVEMRSGMEYGTVCHALTAAVQCILDDWMLLVTQLETQLRDGKLTLQTLWFYVQPAMTAMVIVAELCRHAAAEELQGTELLNLLHQKMKQMAGSQNAQALLQKLLEASLVPYFEALEKWLCDGVIQDPYCEFMIEERPEIQATMTTSDLQSAYWHQRYRMRKTFLSVNDDIYSINCVPTFLRQHADMILTTGKYLNAIRECGRHVSRPLGPDEHLVFDASCSYLSLIQKAHKASSQAFLDMFLKDLKLVDWLRNLKHFFLMDKGDMIGHLMDIAQEELDKVASQVVVNRMQSLLELAYKTSSLPTDINTEPLQVELDHRSFVDLSVCLRQPQRATRTPMRSSRASVAFAATRSVDISGQSRASYLAEELTGWDIFTMRYTVEWPMVLIVPPKLMQMYQLLFKQLFTLKRTEFELGKAWTALQRTRYITNRSLDGVLRVAEVTCYQMQHTVQQYLRHLTVHTVEPRWLAMEAALLKANDVNKVIEIHQGFIEKVVTQSLLRKVKSVKELDQVLTHSLKYAVFVTSNLGVEGESLMHASSGVGGSAKPAEARAERNRMLGVKLEAVLKSGSFESYVLKSRAEYKVKLSKLVATLADYCDMEGAEHSQQSDAGDEMLTRENMDKLLSLIEALKLS